MFNADILAILVIIADIFIVSFLTWRIVDKKATLWGGAKLIYGWIALMSLYHLGVYVATLFSANPSALIAVLIHPLVVLFTINPGLVAIIHWRGGKL